MNKPTKTYCALPWASASLLTGGVIAPCCSWFGVDKFANVSTLKEYFESEDLKKVRQDMLDGKPIQNCSGCYQEEKLGIKSRRQASIEQFGIVTETKLTTVDIDASNACNLKCRGCASTSSHLWYDDEKLLYGDTFSKRKYVPMQSVDEIDFTHIEHLKIAGGEPFLDKQLEVLLKSLVDQDLLKNISLVIDTNATLAPSSVMMNVLLGVKKLRLSCSIDGIDHLNSYFRSSANWQDCLTQFSTFDQLLDLRHNLNTEINIHTTVSIYNVNKLIEIKQFFKEHYPRFFSSHRLAYWPEFISIKNIPVELKNKIKPVVEAWGAEYTDIVQVLSEPGSDMFEHFLNFHDGLDLIRNENLSNSNDMLSRFIADYKTKNPSRASSKEYFVKHLNFFKNEIHK